MTAAQSARGSLGVQARAAALDRLRSQEFDLVVIGGGATGAGVAVDAASRGLRVALLEARDFAAGTSSRSSKLIHGGLRYLEQLDFPLVREALRERGLLLGTTAPHLVKPVPFLLPLQKRVWQRAYYGAGVALYDTLGSVFGTARGMPRHKHLSKREARAIFPSLKPESFIGAIRYYDGQVDDARLVITLARTAAAYGAVVVNSVRVTDLVHRDGAVAGVVATDLESGEQVTVRARQVIAATGVWSDDIGHMLEGVGMGVRVRASKGVHFVVPRDAIDGDAGLILRTEKSVLFVIPWEDHWIVGTTDTDWDLDRAHPAASARDINYLLERVNKVLERPLNRNDIEGVYAGLRPLLSGESDATSALSREHAVVSPTPGLTLIAGGKFTTYRVMAKDAVDAAFAGEPEIGTSVTDNLPLLGAADYHELWRRRIELAADYGLSVPMIEHLLDRYGDLTRELLRMGAEDPAWLSELAHSGGYLRAEIRYAVEHEGALHLDDVLARRTRIAIETTHRGVECAAEVADIMADVLGWDAEVRERELEHYLARVAAERESQRQLDDRTADAARLGADDVRGAVA
ncbi:FAD-dependent oxidoreductase [Epidermidibacterium keratini]|uniref:Glycerol-3-phosphate dehydrogenase n=1 Tax=Epidermidibacterium keratini TaxID=1891644 RepID=A0A7L4YRD6_9ACTN|nr:glycerol-3-phosphate dehydrogenase/oxidase [Epidermidibacterium keratini]QHC01127.1 FAD-dependent oxidoreductase [Epidermidibacterium keratini]